tara:strand:+ start:234 stop:581 length:348 start_codon:yes stop_codon:yes gene_type:complete
MEVKMQYVVELEQVLTEVRKLLPTSASWEYEINTARTYLDKGEVEVVLSILHSLRQSMYHMDQRLADCQAVLGGYMKAKHQPQSDIDISQLQGMIQETEDTLKDVNRDYQNDSDD